jgi:citrate synthase
VIADVIRIALVLCADHELNISAFVARCAASAGASPYDVVSAAMAALKGHKHGGATRAACLLQLAEAGGNEEERRLARQLLKAGADVLDELPNLDFGLVALSRAYGLPKHAPILLFALGRTIGWIAHAIEQYASRELIRPRARYTGPLPSLSAGQSRLDPPAKAAPRRSVTLE